MIATRRSPRHSIVAAALLILSAGAASAHPDRWLRSATDADRRLSYKGVRVVRAVRGDRETERRVRVWHLAPDRTRVEFMGPDGGDLLLELGTGRWLYSQRRGEWRRVEPSSPRPRLDLLSQNYRIRRRPSGTVAGRRVLQLSIEPRHPGNPSKRVWIDAASRMLLREEVRAHDGRLLAGSTFEEFELVTELPTSLFDAPAATTAGAGPDDRSTPPFAPLRPRYLPPGYQLVRESGLRRGPREGVYLRYTDGLGAISLFQFRARADGGPQRRARAHDDGRPRGERRERGERRHRERLTRQIGDLECSVFGDIAPDELRKLIDSLPTP